jgi:uncharacterized protein YciI
MPYFALTYEAVDNFIERRAPFRQVHLTLAKEAEKRGELVMAGALGSPPTGALLVFRSSDGRVAEEFAARDPYVLQGLVRRWEVRPWTVVIGYDPSEPPPGLPTTPAQ